MPKVTIDGKEIEVEPGTTIIRAAERLGIFIPRYCYHPALTIAANCRICLVEVERSPKLLTACSTPVAEGMVVHTNSERVRDAREGIMEFLLINHPLDCPICDQAGECKLQDYTFTYGAPVSRFTERKVRSKKRAFSEHIWFDPNRCIKCTLCIRFCKEIAGADELTLINRGNQTEIATFSDGPVTNPYSCNIVDICPVGALTLRDFRFVERVWDIIQVDSVCPGCSKGCNTILGVKGQRILRVKPRHNPHVNDYWICDYGRFYYDWMNDENRLKAPLIRREAQLAPLAHVLPGITGEVSIAPRRERELLPASWKEAIDFIAESIRRIVENYGPEAVAGIGSTHLTNEDLFMFVKLLKVVIGTPHVAFRPPDGRAPGLELKEDQLLLERDKSPNYEGALDMGLKPDYQGILEGIREGRIRALYIAGSDLVRKVPGVEQILDNLELLIVQDLRVTETALNADAVLPAASYAEKDGTFTNSAGRVQRIRPAFKPVGEARPDWEVFLLLARRLGGDLGIRELVVKPLEARPSAIRRWNYEPFEYRSAEDVFRAISGEVPGYQGMSYENLGGWGMQRVK